MEEVFRACVADERARGRTVLLSCAHPVRGRGAVRPRHDHPRRPHRRDRHARRAAPPDPDHDRGRDGRRRARPRAGRARRAAGACSSGSSRAGVTNLAREPRRRSKSCFLRHYAVTGLRLLLRLALRRDRVMIPAWVLGLGARGARHRVVVRRALRDRGLAARGGRDARAHARHARALRAHLRRLGRRARRLAPGRDRARAGGADGDPARHRATRAPRRRRGARSSSARARRPPRAARRGAARRGARERRARRGRHARGGRDRPRVHAARSRSGCVFTVVGARVRRRRGGHGAADPSPRGRRTGSRSPCSARAFALRAIGDAGPHWLSWLSPLGWGQAVRAYADERWWLLRCCSRCAAALTVVAAVRLAGPARPRRGHPPAAPRPGARRAHARRSTLAWRLQRGALAGWAAGFAILGAAFGSIAQDIGDVIGDIARGPRRARAARRRRRSLVDAYLAATLQILALIAAAYAIQATLRLRGEETERTRRAAARHRHLPHALGAQPRA